MTSFRPLKRLDWAVVVAVLALMVFTWPYMKSASYRSARAGQGYYTSSPQKQIIWIGVGIVLGAALLVPRYRTLAEMSLILYLGGLAMLVVVMVFGKVVNGARSWLVLPANVRRQPSELVKITTIIALAWFLAGRHRVKRMRSASGGLAAFGIAAVPAAMIAAQPDLGTALMFVAPAVAMVFVAGTRIRHLALLAAATLVLLPLAWFSMSREQQGRITAWVRQGQELTQAERVGRFHHMIQSRIAVGSGQVWGRGRGKGPQNRLNYLGYRNTDFMFAVICEEAGFVGANVVIVLYLLLAAAGLSIARRCREPVGRLIAVGVVSLLVVQGFINVAMTIGLLPIVGVTLPFVSYGGSSTLSSLLAVSLLLNVGLRRPKITFAREELTG